MLKLEAITDAKYESLAQYASSMSLRLHPAQEKLIELTVKHPRAVMLSSSDELQFLQNLIRLINGKKILDIGCFTGYSALSFALAIPDDGKVITCDDDAEYPELGKPFWKEAGVDSKIELRLAPASETLDSLIAAGESGTFDFAFIDADKSNYGIYYEQCMNLVRSGGVIVLDNSFLFGNVLTEPPEGWEDDLFDREDVMNMKELSKKLRDDERIDISLLVLGDGTTLCFKR